MSLNACLLLNSLSRKHVMKARLRLTAIAVLSIGLFAAAPASAITISTTGEATLGGVTFQNGDVARHTLFGTSLFFAESNFSSSTADVDALHVRSNGNVILSTDGTATLGGLTFRDGDLVEYNPGSNTATLFFSEDLFSSAEDIDAVHVLNNGNLILSTEGSATLGGLTFNDGDLANYNPISGIATLFFSETNFSISEDIDAVFIQDNGNIVLSTQTNATLGGRKRPG